MPSRRRYAMHQTIRQFGQAQRPAASMRPMPGSGMPATTRSLSPGRQKTRPAGRCPSGCAPYRTSTIMCDRRLNGCSRTIASRRWRGGAAGYGIDFLELGGFFQGRAAPASVRVSRAPECECVAPAGGAPCGGGRKKDRGSVIPPILTTGGSAPGAQQLFQQLGDWRGEVDARLTDCDLARHAGDLAELQAQIEDALRRPRRCRIPQGMAKASSSSDSQRLHHR